MTSQPVTEGSELPVRIRRIRDALLDMKPSISIGRALAFTRVARENPGCPVVLAKARGFYRACETIPIDIGADELIVGHAGGRPRAAIISPDITWRWLAKELDTVASRPVNPYDLAEEDKTVLREEIFPFWEGRSIDETVYSELRELGILDVAFESGIIDCEVKTTSGGGDLSPGYANVLFRKGFRGIREHAEERLRSLHLENPDELVQCHFLRAVTVVCDGVEVLAKRYVTLARELAAKETNRARKNELARIAEVLCRVPMEPPRDFHEALQAIWLGQVAIYLEETNAGTSPGRIDQYLYPFLKRDLDEGKLDRASAEELLCCFFLKFNENTWPLSAFGSQYFAGYMPFQNVVVGGIDAQGRDATNPLSYMIIDCSKRLRVFQPSLSARVHEGSPKEFLLAIAELVSAGIGFPSISYDEPSIRMLQSSGVSLEDARDYCIMACTEPHVHGRLVRWASATYTNFPIAIEFALHDGVHLKTGKRHGLRTGDPTSFDTFEKFEAAVKEQLKHLYRLCTIVTQVVQRAHQRLSPKPVGSALIEGCVDKGKSLMDGGAYYDAGPGIIVVGLADYANSMAAVRKLVYDDKKVSLPELAEATRANFEGFAEIAALCRKAPKYGNDDDYVDSFARDVVTFSDQVIRKHRGLLANLELSTLSVSTNVPQGDAVSALPSGRRAFVPLSDGISPAPGTDVNGPTSVIKSVDKIDPVATCVGTLLNMKIDPSLIANDAGKQKFTALLRAHGMLGGEHIQFNCVSRETLLDAQKHPEQYRSLIVRVAGYSAYFTELERHFQDEVINRTCHQSW